MLRSTFIQLKPMTTAAVLMVFCHLQYLPGAMVRLAGGVPETGRCIVSDLLDQNMPPMKTQLYTICKLLLDLDLVPTSYM